jgi:hypothetical protein
MRKATNRKVPRRAAKGARTPVAAIQTVPPALDCVTQCLIDNGVALTQRNWLKVAYLGAKSSVGDLGGEELADLPEGFEDWPEDELLVN